MSGQRCRQLTTILPLVFCLGVYNVSAQESSGLPTADVLDFRTLANLSVVPLRLTVDSRGTSSLFGNTDTERSLFMHGTLYAGEEDRTGIKRDTAYFMSMQLSILGLLCLSPESISGWSAEQIDEFSLGNWRDNVTRVRWDRDRWWINYLLHPYWGATYYTRARERNYDRRKAFWYSVLLSSLYEFGGEALFENPSIQDLLVTPIAGTLVGLWFEDLRSSIRQQNYPMSQRDKAILVLTDPLGVIGTHADRLLGINKPTLHFGLKSSRGGGMLMVKLRW